MSQDRQTVHVYLAGPMRGIPEFNFPLFLSAAEHLRAAGLDVFNPAEQDLDRGFEYRGTTGSEDLESLGCDLRVALADDVSYIAGAADAVVCLPGWEASRGACAEATLALALDLLVFEYDPSVMAAPPARDEFPKPVDWLFRMPRDPAAALWPPVSVNPVAGLVSTFHDMHTEPEPEPDARTPEPGDEFPNVGYVRGFLPEPEVESWAQVIEECRTRVALDTEPTGPELDEALSWLDRTAAPMSDAEHAELTELFASVPKSGEVRVTSETGGQKGSKPQRFDLIPGEALWTLAEVYGRGSEKYEDRNWQRGYAWSLSFAAMMRHAWQFWNGEDMDEDGLPHLAHAAWHAFALLWFAAHMPQYDDRESATLPLKAA